MRPRRDAEQMRGVRVIDLSLHHAPDLVVEIDDIHLSLDKLDIYARVGVAEVWRWRNGTVTIYAWESGRYAERSMSVAFPTLTATVLENLVLRSRTMRRPDWIRLVREWAQHHAPPPYRNNFLVAE
jgi:hypothetical protein